MHLSLRPGWLAGVATLALTTPAFAAAPVAGSPAAEPAAANATDNSADQADSIVVLAKRADAASLEFRSSVPVAALSQEDLQHTAVHNVAEALGLLPGVNVMNTGSSYFGGVDGASRGEGMFVGIRGLNSEYNVNLINGVNVAQGMPYSRQVQLSLLPPSGLNTIVVEKASTAEMSGDAIGGTVDFRTPNAFDFAKPFHMSVALSGRMETRDQDYGNAGLGGGFNADIAKRFGDEGQFGVYVSGYYDLRHFTNSELGGVMAAQNDGGWGYLLAGDSSGKTSAAGLNPQHNITQTGIDFGSSSGYTTRWGTNASFDWHPDDTTQVYLRGTWASAKTEQDSTLAEYVSDSKSWKQVPGTSNYLLSVNTISPRVWYETNPELASLGTAALGLRKQMGTWTVSPQLFYSEGHNDRPDHIEASERLNQQDNYNNGQSLPLGGQSITYINGLPQPVLTSAISNAMNNANTVQLARGAGQLTSEYSGQTKYGGRVDVSRDIDNSVLQQIRFGGNYAISHRLFTEVDWSNGKFANLIGHGGETWQSLGLSNSYYSQAFPGVYNIRLPKVNQAALFNYFYQYKNDSSLDTCGGTTTDNLNCDTMRGSEAVSAFYLTGTLKSGNLEVIPGLRYEHTAIHNTYWLMGDGNSVQSGWGNNSTHYNEWLPSLFANYRPNSNAVYRADLWWSYTRPAFVQLGGGATVSVGDTVTTITQGNPNLKPIQAMNVDASGEWKFGRETQLMSGFYYKHLRNYMYDNGSGYINSGTLAENTTIYQTPQNGGSGDIYGLEAQLRTRFTGLPEWMGKLGVNINGTRQWTSVDIGAGVMKQVQNAPAWLANAQLFWEKGPAEVDISFKYRGEYVSQYAALGIGTWDDLWVRPLKTVDAHVGYQLQRNVRADFSVANIFGAYSYWSHVGHDTAALSDVVDSGRTLLLTLKWSL
ncbi:TonB-dependent receptor [Novosphingobium sp.]|uniref:TonB-dependent receptor n=1 Tax=Novosphingobium sp. TaxID=1874826 RepID=UPI0031DDC894